MMLALKTLLIVIFVAVMLLFAVLYRNDARLFDPPGFHARLKLFLTTNVAETSSDNLLPELRLSRFEVEADQLYRDVISAGSYVGWRISDRNPVTRQVHFTVSTPVFQFIDDVYVEVSSLDDRHSRLVVRSASRKGKADLAANLSHINLLVKNLPSKESLR